MDCANGQELWPIFRGDTSTMYLELTKLNGKPENIANKILTFTMRIDTKNGEQHYYDLHYSVRIPEDANSKIGRYILTVPAKLMERLLPERTYYYDFQLKDDDCEANPEVDTLGWGTRAILRDITVGDVNAPDSFPTC